MTQKLQQSFRIIILASVGSLVAAAFLLHGHASAVVNRIPDPVAPGSYGLEATKPKPAPTQGATIVTPGNGASYTTSPVAVNGSCPSDLLVEIYNNQVLVGSVVCNKGSFSIQVDLFSGANELTAAVYDELDQAGPPSNTVTVTYSNTSFTSFGSLITTTSSFGRRSAATGSVLSWPIQISGGTGPYALSIDWGDSQTPELKSQPLAGLVTLSHTYKKAGIYQVNLKVTDVNGVTSFFQVVAVASGKATAGASATPGAPNTASDSTNAGAASKPEVLWLPTIIMLLLLPPMFWLGRRSQITSMRNKMLKDRDNYEKEQNKQNTSA